MLRPFVVACAAVLLLGTAGYAAEGGGSGAGSAADYESLAGATNGTSALPSARTSRKGCTLRAPYDEACVDGSACWINDPAAVQDPEQLADVPRPRRDDEVAFMSCVTPSGDQWSRWYWSSDRSLVTD